MLSNVVEHLVHGDPKSELRCATTYLLAVDARNKAAQSVSPLITGAQRTCKDDVEEGVQRTWLMLNPVNDERNGVSGRGGWKGFVEEALQGGRFNKRLHAKCVEGDEKGVIRGTPNMEQSTAQGVDGAVKIRRYIHRNGTVGTRVRHGLSMHRQLST